jgi:hypothetical protein
MFVISWFTNSQIAIGFKVLKSVYNIEGHIPFTPHYITLKIQHTLLSIINYYYI